MLSFDGEPSVRDFTCHDCGAEYRRVKLFILRDGDAYAACFASLHRHSGNNESWLDVILGSWGNDQSDDHVTFGCRVGVFEGASEPAASLVAAAQPFSDSPIFGRKLARDEALRHPRLAEFWLIVDYVLVEDPKVHAHVYRR